MDNYDPKSLEEYSALPSIEEEAPEEEEDVEYEDDGEKYEDDGEKYEDDGEKYDDSEEEVDFTDEMPANVEETTSNQQTPEQNAYYAEQRRQRQLQEQVQRELELQRQQAPEFQVAQLLSEMYGMPVDQLYTQLQEAALQKQAEDRGLPIEVVKQLTEYEQQQRQLQDQLNRIQFENWRSKVDSEAGQLLNQYPMLNQQDVEQAKFYLLETLQNPDIPLQQAVFALYGDKITDSFKNLAKQEAMAEISGRKKGGLPPQSMKTSDGQIITEEERYVARMMGISEKEYMKWR